MLLLGGRNHTLFVFNWTQFDFYGNQNDMEAKLAGYPLSLCIASYKISKRSCHILAWFSNISPLFVDKNLRFKFYFIVCNTNMDW